MRSAKSRKIAVLQFPGTNREEETARALKKAGFKPEIFRWNCPDFLQRFGGVVIPGGFSYEDRSRAGIIASLDPVMEQVKAMAEIGKPVLGICNGAQILLEAGLIAPGALAPNHCGYFYNDQVWIKGLGFCFKVPVAHGEGRFVFPSKAIAKKQIVFCYAGFNPNGSMYDVAAVSNKAGNVLAIMPHPEDTKEGIEVFKKFFRERQRSCPAAPTQSRRRTSFAALTKYQQAKNSTILLVDLIITDNEAWTVQNTLRQLGIKAEIKRHTFWEIGHRGKLNLKKIISSGELLNTNKEKIIGGLRFKVKGLRLLVVYKDDPIGQSKSKRLGLKIRKGVVWEIKGEIEKILATRILFNKYSQKCYRL